MRWTEKDEQRLLARINGDAKPPGTWKLLFWGVIGVLFWVTLLMVKL